MEEKNSNMPRHVGIILDGNRRYAKKLSMEPWNGHKKGAEKLEKLFKWAEELGVKELTLYCFSIENFNRSKTEVDFLMNLFRTELKRLNGDEEVMKKGVKVRFIGRISMFSEDIRELMESVMEKTKDNSKYFLNFAMAYGGRSEITNAAKSLAREVKEGKINPEDIDKNVFAEHLYLNSDMDLLIRTSGEKRISGFMLWQMSYAELYFVDKFWPEFEKEDLVAAIEDFSKRERRLGR